ncbi:MAG: nucleotidyltransferase domain-containing protein, partial [Syntrophales bacterium]
KLEQMGILRSRKEKRRLIRTNYALNPDFLLYDELRSIFLKTTGAVGVLKSALSNTTGINYAFIYGSVASGNEGPSSDIDLMVIGNIPVEALSKILRKSEETLGRDINPSVYSLEEFKRRLMKVDPFMSKIMDEPRTILVEKDDALQNIIG